MTDEELIASLRGWPVSGMTNHAAAARIEALVKERDDFADQVANLLPAVNREAVEQRSRAERLEAAIRELKRCWYQGDLTENDFAAALKGAADDRA